MKKRILSILLAFCMVMGLVPTTVSAMQTNIDLTIVGGANLTLGVESGDSIENIKQKIQDEIDLPADRQKLIFNGRELADDRSLMDYNIQKKSTLLLQLLSGRAIQISTNEISDPVKTVVAGKGHYWTPKSYIYFGINGTAPIKWRVLDADRANDGKTTGMFLLSEYLLSNNVKYNYVLGTNTYNDSDAQWWCRDFAANKNGGTFTDPERDAIRTVSKTDTAEKLYGQSWGQGGLSDIDNLFFLSVREATDYIGNYDNAPGLTATDIEGNADSWWLRSPVGNAPKMAGLVHSTGVIDVETVNYVHAARPALNLNTSAIRMISAAAGGKSANGTEKGLAVIPAYSGNEWKLTLFDSAQKNFLVSTSDVTTSTDGGTVKIEYTGAKTGDNEYVSAILLDENRNPLCYGRSMQPVKAENGTAEFAVPAGLAQGEYTLSVFSEQYNGDYKTDYVSNFFGVRFTVEETPAEQFALTPGGTYYFDLSSENIPGMVNSALPDSSLHYVPFTYAGTVNAYVLKAASDGVPGSSGSASRVTDPAREHGYTYLHGLFVADYTVTQRIGWDRLNEAGFIFGKTYQSGDISYTLRAPTVGSTRSGTTGSENERGTPLRNEWDTILDKNGSFIKNWAKTDSWGQDTSDAHAGVQALYRAYRGFVTARTWSDYPKGDNRISYRPVLEVQNAASLGKNGIKAVTLDLGGNTLDGESSIKIVVKSGESFKAPAAEGLPRPDGVPTDAPLWWTDGNGNIYKPGDTVPADVSKLSIAGYDVTYRPGAYGVGSAVTDNKLHHVALTLRGALFTRSGYTQTGWATIDGGEKVYGFEDVYTADEALTLYPVWTPNRYTVTFDGNGGTVAQETMTVTYDESLDPMPIPRYKGYFFAGWFDQKWGGRQYSDKYGHSTTPYDKTEDCTLYAMWIEAPLCTVTFDPNGGTLTGAATCEEKQNESIQRPDEEPVREGYNFLGWYKDAACTQRWDFNDPIPGNMTLYAGWQILSYTIRVKPANGEQDIIIDVNFGTAITPPLLTREGYTFIGWDIPFPEKMPAKMMTITAQWKVNQYTITFDTDGGSQIDPITQDYGTTIAAPDAPTREGYTFTGWNKEIPATMPAENITLTAQWRDTEKPTGTIAIDENQWNSFLNAITFGLFFKETQTVTITAADNSGKAVKIEYLLSNTERTEAELTSEAFTAYDGAFNINPDNEYIVYVRLTDEAGNVANICSDGIVLDGTAPVIDGIEDGKTYCAAQTVTVTEAHLKTVTVNDKEVALDDKNQLVLSPATGEQTIVVTDKAGNTAQMTVTVNDGHTALADDGDCTTPVYCQICNAEVVAAQQHDFSGAWLTDENGHWHACQNENCTVTDIKVAHSGTDDGDCTTAVICECGYVCTAAQPAHTWGEWVSNENGTHTRRCTVNGCTAGVETGDCADADHDHQCDTCDYVLSECTDADHDHHCDLCGKELSPHTGGKATCTAKAECEVCGEPYGELDAHNHADWRHVEAKAATEEAAGNIEYWYCAACGAYFADEAGAQPITEQDTVITQLEPTKPTATTTKPTTTPSQPQTGDSGRPLLWFALLFVSGGAVIGTTAISKKKKGSVK